MKNIILSIIIYLLITWWAFANNNIKNSVFYIPSWNYYYITDSNQEWFIDWTYSIKNAMTDEEELWEIFNSLFPENSCYITECWINKKKLLFEAVLKYSYEKTSEYEDEIDIAKTRYENDDELEDDLNEIEEKVSVLIDNKDSYKESWYNTWKENQWFQICATSIENWIIKYNFTRKFISYNRDIFTWKYYLLALPLNIDTWIEYDSFTLNNFSWKNNVIEINTSNDIENISNFSKFEEIDLEKIDDDNFSINIDYNNIKDTLEEKLSNIYDTYNKELEVKSFNIILFYENNDWELNYISDIISSYNQKKQSFIKSCENVYKINNEESFYIEVYNEWLNKIVSTENNNLFLKKIDNVFTKLDNMFDFWDLESDLDKEDYYLILKGLKTQIEQVNITINEKIEYYSNQDNDYLNNNKEQIENFFEKKMFIDYIEKKVNFRIEEGLIEYYNYDK